MELKTLRDMVSSRARVSVDECRQGPPWFLETLEVSDVHLKDDNNELTSSHGQADSSTLDSALEQWLSDLDRMKLVRTHDLMTPRLFPLEDQPNVNSY